MLMDNNTQQTLPPVPPTQIFMNPTEPKAKASPVEKKKDKKNIVKIVVIVILSLMTIIFASLMVYEIVQYNNLKDNFDTKTAEEVAKAEAAQAERLEKEFAEREKNPYKTFAGPVDYGELSFKYPKTWSVYIAKDATTGGDFEAYFTPGEVEPVSNKNINALRVIIRDKSYESVVQEYNKQVSKKNSTLSVETITVNGTTANHYIGTIPNTELNGHIVVFKIRDKTAILQTDSNLFLNDFNTLLLSVGFNA